jgi:adenosine deaminase CECR1
VDDVRNHPLQTFVAEGLPMSISPDDPGLWGAVGASYDWTVAFLSMDARAGIAALKQLAINSLVTSGMSDVERKAAMKAWQPRWKAFVEGLAAESLHA